MHSTSNPVDQPWVAPHPSVVDPLLPPIQAPVDVAQSNRPRVGDYLQAPHPTGHRMYIVSSTDGFNIKAVSATLRAGLVTLETTWPRLAVAGFRLRRYDDMQEERLRMFVILASLLLFAALTFVFAAPLSFTQVVSMSIALLVGHVAVTVLNGYKRDFLLHRTIAQRV